MGAADRVVKYVFQGDIKGLQASLAAGGASVRKFGTDLNALDKNGAKMRAGLTAVGGTARDVGLVAAVSLAAVAVATARFDKAMSNVQAATHETASNMDLLRDAAIEAGAKTAFSASEAAAGIENLAKAGISTKDVLAGGLSGALDLAAAGEMDVADAAETAATALTMFKLEGSDVPHVADLLAAAAGKAKGDVSDMAMALNQSGLVAAQTGLTIEETTGTLAAFASAGLVGSDAGTSFKTMLQSLTPTGAKAASEMERLGITAYDAQGNFVGMTEFAANLRDGLSDLSVEQQNAAMKTIFGSDAVRAASVVFQQGAEGIGSWITKVDDSGYAAETAATRLDNLMGDLEAFKGSLETALISSGEGSQGMLRNLVQGATDAVNAFNDLPPALKNVSTGMLGITAVAGGGLWFGAKVIGGIADTRTALSDLGVTAGRTGRVLRTALTVTAILEGLNLLDQGIDAVFDHDLEASNLGRSLDALASGDVAGTILETFGSDLDDFGATASGATSSLTALSRAVNGVPLVGGLIAGGAGDDVENIEKLDQALASMVESGNQEQAVAVFEQLAAAAAEAGVSAGDFAGLFEQYAIALKNSEGAAAGAAAGTEHLTGSAVANTNATKDNTQAIRDNIDAMQDKRSAAIAASNGEIAYQQAIDDAKASLKENGKTLDITTEKGRNNVQSLNSMAEGWNGLTARQQNAKGAFKSAQDALYDQARAFGATKAEANEYVRKLLEIPPKRVTDIEARTEAAAAKVAQLKSLLDQIQSKSITVTAAAVTAGPFGFLMGRADGGTIPGSSPHKRADNIPLMATAGEFMHQVDAVNYYGVSAMHAINQRRIPRSALAGYAGGGEIQHLASGGDVREFRQAARGFNPEGDLGVRGVRAELREFSRAVDSTGKHFGHLSARLVDVTGRYVKVSAALDREREQRRDLIADQRSYQSSVRGSFDNDIFGNGAEGLSLQLRADANDANAMRRATRKADAKGLSGGLEKALLASGDLNTAQQISRMSRGQIANLERMYAQRAQAQGGLARFAGQEVFGKQIAHQNRIIHRQNKTLDRLDRRLEGLENSVERGARRGVGDRDRNTNQRRKAGR